MDRAEAYQQTETYQQAMRKRSLWVEPLFGEAKQFHRLRRFRLRGMMKVNIEGVLVAAGQNIKRLVKHGLNCFLLNIATYVDSSPLLPGLFQQAEFFRDMTTRRRQDNSPP